MKRYLKNTIEEKDIRILLIDTQELLLKTIASILSVNYQIYLETDITNINKAIKKNNPHIISVNYDLLGINVLNLIKEIKRKYPEILIITIIEYKDLQTIISYIHEGIVSSYIQKPINIENLRNIIHSTVLKIIAVFNQKKLLNTIKKQNLELNRQNTELKEINKKNQEFIRNIIFQLATPLTNIITSTELILTDAELELNEKTKLIKTIHKNAIFLTQTLKSTAAMGRFIFKEFILNPTNFMINDIEKDLNVTLRPFIIERDIKMQFSYYPLAFKLYIDKELLHLIITNILIKLMDFIKELKVIKLEFYKNSNEISLNIDIDVTEKEIKEKSDFSFNDNLDLEFNEKLLLLLNGHIHFQINKENQLQLLIKFKEL